MTEQPELLYVVEDRVATITFHRPHRHNALTRSMFRGYYDLLARAEADEEVRVVVVTGAGKAFSVGADFGVLQALSDADPADLPDDPHSGLGYPVEFPVTLAKPVIAAVNGAAAGLGLVHALYADLRFAAADAKLTTAFSRRGLIAEYGMSWLLPRLVGVANALDLLLSARTLTAEEAFGLGLVQKVVPPGEACQAALAYAKEMAAQCSPRSLAVIKAQVYGDLERGLGPSASDAVRLMVDALRDDDVVEGVASFLEKRDPAFPPYRGDPSKGARAAGKQDKPARGFVARP
jgi:enoyl-CoA hydratase/carnithine racemase